MLQKVKNRNYKHYLAFFGLFVGFLSLNSCKTENKDPVYANQYGTEFLPINKNQYREYVVDTLSFNKLGVIMLDSGRVFQRREVVSLLDSSNLYKSFKVNVYQRNDTIQPWRFKQIDIEFVRFDGAYILQERDIQSQLLLTPFSRGTSWNINAFNTQNQSTAYTLSFLGVDGDSIARFAGVRDSTCLTSQLETVTFMKGKGLFSRYTYKASFVDDPLNPCSQPVAYQTRQYSRWTFIKSGNL